MQKNTPEILNVTEEHEQRRQDQPDPNIEERQTGDWVQEEDELPGERDVVQDAEQDEHAQGQSEIDECLHVLREQEEVLRHVDFGKDPGVSQQTGHSLVRRFPKVREHKVPAEEVGGIMRDIPPEKLCEYKPHHQQRQQRGQHAPGHA